jgi:hypothetical protein
MGGSCSAMCPIYQHLASPARNVLNSDAAAWLVDGRALSVNIVRLTVMEVTDRHIARIPAGNLRVPRAQFAAVWRAAEQRNQDNVLDWYAGAVVVTCRWLAATTVRNCIGGYGLAPSPIARRTSRSYEELIEAEALAADNLALRRPDLVASRPGWCEGIRRTFAWAWRHEGPPPLPIPDLVGPSTT